MSSGWSELVVHVELQTLTEDKTFDHKNGHTLAPSLTDPLPPPPQTKHNKTKNKTKKAKKNNKQTKRKKRKKKEKKKKKDYKNAVLYLVILLKKPPKRTNVGMDKTSVGT